MDGDGDVDILGGAYTDHQVDWWEEFRWGGNFLADSLHRCLFQCRHSSSYRY
jgi:hypothetical protein